MKIRLSAWLGAGCLFAVLCMPVHAQNPVSVNPQGVDKPDASLDVQALPERIAQERHRLSVQREAILQTYEKQMVACWEKFAVNACLLEARRARRKALDPLAQQELVLNAQERAWRSEQRDLRLQGKPPENRGTP